MDASTLQLIILPAGIIAILFALYLARDVLSRDTGTQAMRDVHDTIYEGAVAFIRRQYTTIAILAVVGAVLIGIVIGADRDRRGRRRAEAGGDPDRGHDRDRLPGRRHLLDGVGDHRHVRRRQGQRPDGVGRPPEPRRGGPGRDARRRGVRASSWSPCRSSGVWGIFMFYSTFVGEVTVAEAPFLIVGFGFGASFVALFAQLGGGIYTKAADVGSDLVGKVEKGIPEDDPRNAGVVADLVGDNVGDCAGRGADLFESTAAENIGAMILGVAVYAIAAASGWPNPQAWIFFPLVVRAFGLLATIVAIFFVRGKEDENPMNMLNRGYWVTTLLSVVGLAITTAVMMNTNGGTGNGGLPTWVYFFFAGIVGLATSVAFVYITQYYTAGTYPPGTRDRRGVQDRPGHQHHLRHRRRLRDDRGHGDHHLHRPVHELLARQPGPPGVGDRRGRRWHLRHRRRDDGHAHDDRLHPGHGHLRPDHRQRRRDRRVQPGRGRRARDHRPPRCRRQHDQGPDQGLRDRLRLAGGVPAVQRLHRQDQPHPGPPDRSQRPRRRAAQLGQPGERQRVHRGPPRGDARLLLQLARDPRRRQHGPVDHRRGPPPVPRDARDHGLHAATRTTPGSSTSPRRRRSAR